MRLRKTCTFKLAYFEVVESERKWINTIFRFRLKEKRKFEEEEKVSFHHHNN